MGDFTFTPWRRYGHDRVYIQRGDEQLGYLDRASGALVLDDDTHGASVRHALVAAGLLPPPPQPEWAVVTTGDTATFRPGGSARAMAEAHRAAAPLRTTFARLRGVHTDERAWRVGAEGEERVARRLARLPDPWFTVHDVPLGDRGANVDHVVVGPGGVFSLNTKNLSGRAWVAGGTFLQNGQSRDYVRDAAVEARRSPAQRTPQSRHAASSS